MPEVIDNGAVHEWFSLSYTNYMILQRRALESMPLEWQERFVALIEEMHESLDIQAIGIQEWPDTYWVRLHGARGQFIHDPLAEYRHAPRIPLKGMTCQSN
jgi:hypothetical protein